MIRYSYFLALLLLFGWIKTGKTALYAQIAEGGTPASYAYQEELQLRTAHKAHTVSINFDVFKLRTEDSIAAETGALLRTSMILPVDLNMGNAGEWTVLPNGMKIWRLTVSAPGAIAVMLYYDRFFIPEGGQLFIYNTDHTHLLGAYTSNANPKDKKFATEFVAGDEIILEYNQVDTSIHGLPDVRISGIGYGYNYLEAYQDDSGFLKSKGIGGSTNQSCQVNINCPEGNNWQDHKKGVAKTIAPVGNSGYLCSGTVINNTAQDLMPYYLSAHHCFDDSNISFDQIVFYFHYESEGCETTTPANTKTIIGAQMLVDLPINGSSDGVLLKLNSDIPADYGVYYNGWSRQNTAATSGVGIHHPKGDIKKIATFTSPLKDGSWSAGGDQGASDAHWQVDFAKTQSGYSQPEGGSSGSPLFNQHGLVVGTLTGGTPFNCASGSSNWYGKLWYHWTAVNAVANNSKTMKDYLDPLNTGVESLNGTYNVAIGNIDLINLTVNQGTLAPVFNPAITGYNVKVADNIESIHVSATPADIHATVTGTGSHTLLVGANTIRVIVTAPDKSSSKTYTITVNRAITLSPDIYEPNNTFAQAKTLSVTFSNDVATIITSGSNFHNETDIDYYKLDLPTDHNYIISAILYDLYNNDDNNTYTVDAQFACSTNGESWSDEYDDIMQGNIVILFGGTVYFRVTPFFEGDIGSYMLALTVERKQAGNNDNADLNALSITPGSLYPAFNAGRTNYSVTVGNSIVGVLVTAETSDANATISGVGYHPVQVGANTIPVVVTAQNGTTKKTYTISVVRSVNANNNAGLYDLTIDPGALSPRFSTAALFTNYTATVDNTISQINVSATPYDEYATVTGAGEHPLEVGNNVINIVVTAENGSTFKTYSINVTRESSVGMESSFNQSTVAYPNPARDRITISGLADSGTLTLFDAVGRERLHQTITSSKEIMDVSVLPSGIYLIRVVEGEKTSIIKVIIN